MSNDITKIVDDTLRDLNVGVFCERCNRHLAAEDQKVACRESTTGRRGLFCIECANILRFQGKIR